MTNGHLRRMSLNSSTSPTSKRRSPTFGFGGLMGFGLFRARTYPRLSSTPGGQNAVSSVCAPCPAAVGRADQSCCKTAYRRGRSLAAHCCSSLLPAFHRQCQESSRRLAGHFWNLFGTFEALAERCACKAKEEICCPSASYLVGAQGLQPNNKLKGLLKSGAPCCPQFCSPNPNKCPTFD